MPQLQHRDFVKLRADHRKCVHWHVDAWWKAHWFAVILNLCSCTFHHLSKYCNYLPPALPPLSICWKARRWVVQHVLSHLHSLRWPPFVLDPGWCQCSLVNPQEIQIQLIQLPSQLKKCFILSCRLYGFGKHLLVFLTLVGVPKRWPMAWVRDSPGRNDTCCNWLGFQITKPSMNQGARQGERQHHGRVLDWWSTGRQCKLQNLHSFNASCSCMDIMIKSSKHSTPVSRSLQNGLSVLVWLIPWARNTTQIKKELKERDLRRHIVWLGARHDREIIIVPIEPPAHADKTIATSISKTTWTSSLSQCQNGGLDDMTPIRKVISLEHDTQKAQK